MPPKIHTLQKMTDSRAFLFARLEIADIDNSAVLRINVPEMVEQEICLFHTEVSSGDQYFRILHQRIEEGVRNRQPTPVVRFADGEYAFYEEDLHCNGLYQQAESSRAIRNAMPMHIEALRFVAASGLLTPLIFPGNIRPSKKGLLSFLKKPKPNPSALRFIDFLSAHGVELTRDNYLPFYVVYAYLTSETFARLVDRKHICLVSSECQMESCRKWFALFSSNPCISFADIPDAYVATRWPAIRETAFKKIPAETDLCLVGAGVGALPACADIARQFSIPAIDAGHVLNMMNGQEAKSGGGRLYTLRKARTTGSL